MKFFSVVFFFVVALVNVFCNKSDQKPDSKPWITWLKNISKVLIIPGLLLIYCTFSPSVKILMICALLCGWIGDISLMIHFDKKKRIAMMISEKNSENSEKLKNAKTIKKIFTVIGAIFFAAGHILYCILFFKNSYSLVLTHVLLSLMYLPYLVYGLIIFPVIFKNNNEMQLFKVPAFIYLVIITLMSYASLIQLIHTPNIGSIIVFTGTLSFILSDSVLAFNQINVQTNGLERLIMGSYITAQLLIVIGALLFF